VQASSRPAVRPYGFASAGPSEPTSIYASDVTRLLRRVQRAVVACGIVTLGVLVGAGSASAHAELVGTYPVAGAQLTDAPRTIELRFSEGVEIALGAIRIFDSAGRQLDIGDSRHTGDGRVVQVELDAPSTDNTSALTPTSGQYVVAWRVVSTDGHPVSGAFVFTVGTTGPKVDPAFVQSVLASDGGDTTVGALMALGRTVLYAALAILIGGLAFLVWCWPKNATAPHRATALLWTAGALALLASMMQISLQGAYATGRTLSGAFEPSLWRAVLRTRTGNAWLIRSLAITALLGIVATRSRRDRLAWRVAAVGASIAVLVAVAFGGHGANGRAPVLGTVATVVHVAAASIWVGGLVMLVVVLFDAGAPRSDVAQRFSRLALWSVGVVGVTGTIQALRQVGGFDAVGSTRYGKLLILKVAVVALVFLSAMMSRRVVRVGRPSVDGALNSLRWTVASEVVGAAAVLVLTSLLVNTAPAVAVNTRPFAATVFQGDRAASITVEPARVGPNDIHITLTSPSGSFATARTITAQLLLPERSVGPLALALQPAGPNHVIASGVTVPFAGTWRLEVTARYDEFTEVQFGVDVKVR
jgi:copper transport protein